MRKFFYLLLTLLTISCSSNDEKFEDTVNIEISTDLKGERKKLYELIMEYRKDNNLPIIPSSKSLNFVAQTHVIDLEENQPVQGNCNLHSWSNNGNWTPVCYTSDHKQAKGMWIKPSELTNYKGYGYEISFYNGGGIKSISTLNGWKKSSGHNNLILNRGMWKSKWNAIGIGIYKHYAVVWFGNEKDNN